MSGYSLTMGVGGFFLLIVVIVVLVVAVLALTGNISWLGWRGSDPERQGAPGTSAGGDPSADEQPRHTRVDLDQNTEREPHGEPVDRAP
jgi:hypothetical protein